MARRKTKGPPVRTSVLNLESAEFGPAFLEECLARVEFAKAEDDYYGPLDRTLTSESRVGMALLDCLHAAKRTGEREESRRLVERYRNDTRGVRALGELRTATSLLLRSIRDNASSSPTIQNALAMVLRAEENFRYALGSQSRGITEDVAREGELYTSGNLPPKR